MTRIATFLLTACISVVGCAAKETAEPIPVAVQVEFPSPPTAVVTDSLRIIVWEGRSTARSWSASVTRAAPAHGPHRGLRDSVRPARAGREVRALAERGAHLLVAAQVGEKDFLLGCSREQIFGEVVAARVSLTYASNEFTLSTLQAQSPGSTTNATLGARNAR